MAKEIAKTGEPNIPSKKETDTALSAELVDGTLSISGGKDVQQQLVDSLASECPHYSALMLGQLLPVLGARNDSDPKDVTHAIRCAAEMLKGFAPQNQVEAMQAVQAVGAHMAATLLTRRTLTATMLPQMEANGNLANKFMRTFSAQVEGLAKLRRNGEQVVKHVHVNEGGQAVIAGTVNTGGPAR